MLLPVNRGAKRRQKKKAPRGNDERSQASILPGAPQACSSAKRPSEHALLQAFSHRQHSRARLRAGRLGILLLEQMNHHKKNQFHEYPSCL